MFPPGSESADAVRFSITRDADGAIDVLCIFEKDYSPMRHTPLLYDTAAANFATPFETANIQAQAHQFIGSYLERKLRA